MRALDIVRAEEAGIAEGETEAESDTELEETEGVPFETVKSKPKSGKAWYSVTRGNTVGVFNDL